MNAVSTHEIILRKGRKCMQVCAAEKLTLTPDLRFVRCLAIFESGLWSCQALCIYRNEQPPALTTPADICLQQPSSHWGPRLTSRLTSADN